MRSTFYNQCCYNRTNINKMQLNTVGATEKYAGMLLKNERQRGQDREIRDSEWMTSTCRTDRDKANDNNTDTQ